MNEIGKRQAKNKELLLEELKKRPIVQYACEKLGIGRATYYRWRTEDPQFAEKADQALREGSLLVNDMAESQLMSAIRDKNLTAIIFWLKNHHPSYKPEAVKVFNEFKFSDIDPEIIAKGEALWRAATRSGKEEPAEPKPKLPNP